MKLKRKRVTRGWYEITTPNNRVRAGIRYHSRGTWGVYFRDGQRNCVPPTSREGQELLARSYSAAVAMVATVIGERQ